MKILLIFTIWLILNLCIIIYVRSKFRKLNKREKRIFFSTTKEIWKYK